MDQEEDKITAEGGNRKRRYLFLIFILLGLIVVIPAGVYIKMRIEQSDPNYYLKFQMLGNSYFAKGMWKEAAAQFEKAVEISPDRFETHYSLGLTYLKLRRLKPASQEFVESLKLDPNNQNARYSLAVTYQRMGQYGPALREYHELAKSTPGSFQLFNNVGMIHLAMKDYEKAALSLKHAIQLKADYYPAYLNLGQVYETQGKKKEAAKVYQELERMASGKPETEPYALEAKSRMSRP